jgi:hypothetical protein
MTILLLILVTVLLILSVPLNQLNPLGALDSNGLKIYLKANISDSQLYVRTNIPDKNLVLSENYPRFQSSTFEMFISEYDNCFTLKSLNGNWLRIDRDGLLSASGSSHISATSFSFFYVNNDRKSLKIRLCKSFQFVQLYNQSTSNNFAFSSNISSNFQNSPIYSLHSQPAPPIMTRLTHLYYSLFSSRYAYYQILNNSKDALLFEIEEYQQFRGVNLGGWFIPEVWMLSSFFEGTGLGWDGSLCAMVNYSIELTEDRMVRHLSSWITENDFREISSYGFNSVRLPIGYWNVIEDPYERYAPSNLSSSLFYIDWAFDMAEKYNLSILIDLHGVPGSQNGQDHSGCGFSILGQPQWTKRQNFDLTLKSIEAIADRYIPRVSLLGIELMNEPSQLISENNHTLLQHYYEDAYWIIRSRSNTTFVVFNELYEHCFPTWDAVLLEPMYFNVFVDWHLYDWQGVRGTYSRARHLRDARNWRGLIDKFAVKHPVIVGTFV